MSPDQILAVLAVLAALTTAEPDDRFMGLRDGGYDDRYPVTLGACPHSTGVLEVEGTTIQCGTVSVPEDYDKPDGRRVDLEFAIFDALSQSPSPDPIVYLHGGPAGGTLHMLDAVADRLYANHRRTRDIVTFDQRAAALSAGSVQCYEIIADHIVDLVPVELGQMKEPDIDDIIAPCIAEIKASGADLSAYNTVNNARDVSALMSALGYPTYNLYGISYGTRLALEVLRTVPDGVRSAVIDGVAAPTERIYDDLLVPHVDALDALVAQCAEDTACNAAYPDLKTTIVAAFDHLEKTPVPSVRGLPALDGGVLCNLTLGMRNNWRNQLTITPYLPRIFAELAEGDSTTLDAFLAQDDPDPAAAVRQTGDMTPDEAALLSAAIDIALAMEGLEDAAATAILQLRDDLATEDTAVRVAEAFEARSNQAAVAISDRTAKLAMVRDYALLQRSEPSAEALRGWVRRHFAGRDQADLLRLISTMTEADVARTFEIADDEATKYELILGHAFNVEIYACQEDVPWNSIEGFKARLDTIARDWTFMNDPGFLAFGESFYSQCAQFDQHPREGWHSPIVTDVPVLAVNGLLDVQTSWKWGANAIAEMTNARNIVVPEAGHGAISYQPCANDITVAFIADPAAELDTACLATLAPTFLLPDDPLPW